MTAHDITWPMHGDTERGTKTRRAVCSCGWVGMPGEPGLVAGTTLGQRHEAEQHVQANSTHDAMVGHSGKYVRIECECGHNGEWRHKDTVTLQRLLDSDRNAHFWQLKRMEANR